MKIWTKVYLICMVLYFVVLNVTGIFMIEKNHSDALAKVIQQSLNEEKNAQNIAEVANVYAYMQTYNISLQNDAKIAIYTKIEAACASDFTWSVLFDEKMNQIASNNFDKIVFNMSQLDKDSKYGARYGLRENNGHRYLCITHVFDNKYILYLVKDISYVNENKKDQYIFLFRLELAGLILLAIITPFTSRYLTNPIKNLTKSVNKIISGNLSERVDVKGKDEIGILAMQFNTMATEIERQIYELDEQAARKQKFIDNLIHEIRTPLTSIIGYSDFLISQKYDLEVLFKSLKNINTEGKRLLESADKLMDLILLKNHDAINKKNEYIKELLHEVVADMKGKLEANEIIISIEAGDIIIPIDRDLIKGVIINLIDNGIKASEKGGKIVIGSYSNNENAFIFVKDKGKGIPQSELERVFEPFYRVDKARSKNDGGAGLGLAICFEIVKAHGAELKIQSEVGKGTRVEITF
jgi:signal transduction histidine kinase